VADTGLGPGAIAREPLLGSARGRVLSFADERARVGEVPVRGVDPRPAVERDFARQDAERVKLAP
jgi:hypothetical protein